MTWETIGAVFAVLIGVGIAVFGSSTSRAWRPLVIFYRTRGSVPDPAIRNCRARLGRFRLEDRGRGLLILGATPQGLYLSLAPPYNWLNSPLRIPWREIAVALEPNASTAVLTFERCNGVPLRIDGEVAIQLLSSIPEMHLRALSLRQALESPR